jgi:molybdopterin-guanine dinucleotide biosynthesis protein A
MLRRGAGENRIEPFPFACRKAAADAIAAQLASGGRPLQSLLTLPRFVAEDAPPGWHTRVWTNLNAPEDYQAFVKAMRPSEISRR